MNRKIALMAVKGLADENYKETLELILKVCTDSPSKQEAYKKGLDMRAQHYQLATVDDINLKEYKAKYGYFKGYPVIQLALDFFQMSNDLFFEKYHFNYVPRDKVFDEVQQLVSDIQVKKQSFKQMSSMIAAASVDFAQGNSIAVNSGQIDHNKLSSLLHGAGQDVFRSGAR